MFLTRNQEPGTRNPGLGSAQISQIFADYGHGSRATPCLSVQRPPGSCDPRGSGGEDISFIMRIIGSREATHEFHA